MCLKDSMKEQLCSIAQSLQLDKLILFGSRAKGTCWERSDIDLAAPFKDARQYYDFMEKIEEIPTLLIFDVVDLNSDIIDLDIRESINKEGIVIYEKI